MYSKNEKIQNTKNNCKLAFARFGLANGKMIMKKQKKSVVEIMQRSSLKFVSISPFRCHSIVVQKLNYQLIDFLRVFHHVESYSSLLLLLVLVFRDLTSVSM